MATKVLNPADVSEFKATQFMNFTHNSVKSTEKTKSGATGLFDFTSGQEMSMDMTNEKQSQTEQLMATKINDPTKNATNFFEFTANNDQSMDIEEISTALKSRSQGMTKMLDFTADIEKSANATNHLNFTSASENQRTISLQEEEPIEIQPTAKPSMSKISSVPKMSSALGTITEERTSQVPSKTNEKSFNFTNSLIQPATTKPESPLTIPDQLSLPKTAFRTASPEMTSHENLPKTMPDQLSLPKTSVQASPSEVTLPNQKTLPKTMLNSTKITENSKILKTPTIAKSPVPIIAVQKATESLVLNNEDYITPRNERNQIAKSPEPIRREILDTSNHPLQEDENEDIFGVSKKTLEDYHEKITSKVLTPLNKSLTFTPPSSKKIGLRLLTKEKLDETIDSVSSGSFALGSMKERRGIFKTDHEEPTQFSSKIFDETVDLKPSEPSKSFTFHDMPTRAVNNTRTARNLNLSQTKVEVNEMMEMTADIEPEATEVMDTQMEAIESVEPHIQNIQRLEVFVTEMFNFVMDKRLLTVLDKNILENVQCELEKVKKFENSLEKLNQVGQAGKVYRFF